MARTTNSDTLPYVESRYELGMLASQRVRDLNGGAEPVVEKNRDKLTVVALREIDAELENALADDAPIEDAADVMDEVMAEDISIDEE